MSDGPEPKALDPGALFGFLAEHSPDLLAIADTNTVTYEWLSPRWSSVLGWSLEELQAVPFTEFVHPDDLLKTQAETANLTTGATTLDFENRYRTKDGRWVWLQWSAMSLPSGLTYAVARDVTARKELELQRAEQAKLLELAAELARVGFWRIDLATNGLYWSEQVYKIHGLDPETFELTVERAIEAYHPDDRERVAACVASAIERREPFDFELRLIRSDGAVRDVVSKGRVQVDQTDAPVAVFGIFQDVTESRALQERVRQSERLSALGTLAAGVAHELNNPLTYVFGHLDQLRLAVSDPELLRRIDETLQGAEHMRQIVAGLRAFSRDGSEGSDRRDLALGDVLDAAVKLCAHQLKHLGDLVEERTSPLPLVHGDRTSLVQVVVNLLLNAGQALPEGRTGNRIVLRARREGDEAVIEVEDNGAGIPAEIQPRVFDPFFTTREVGEGTGLGLAICHGTIEQHGGVLELESEPGRTVFRAQLPVREVAPRTPDSARDGEPPRAPRRGRVLLIDDDRMVGGMLELGISAFADVIYVGSAREGLERLQEETFDAVVCDVMMPEMSGWELHAQVAERWPELADRFVFITGGVFTPEGTRFLTSLPEEQLLEKPFSLPALSERLRRFLG